MERPDNSHTDTEALLLAALDDATRSFAARAVISLDAAAAVPARLRKIPWQNRLTEPVAAALQAWGGPFGAHAKYLITLDNGRKSFGAGTAAAALADVVLAGTSAASALQSLKDAFATNRATGRALLRFVAKVVRRGTEKTNGRHRAGNRITSQLLSKSTITHAGCAYAGDCDARRIAEDTQQVYPPGLNNRMFADPDEHRGKRSDLGAN